MAIFSFDTQEIEHNKQMLLHVKIQWNSFQFNEYFMSKQQTADERNDSDNETKKLEVLCVCWLFSPNKNHPKDRKQFKKIRKKYFIKLKKKKIPVCDLSCCWPDHFYFVKNVHLLIWAGNTEYSITCALIEMSWIRICKNSESESESKSEFNQLLHTKHSTVE